MAQRKQVTWTELRVGLFVVLATAFVAVVVFYVTGGNALGPKYQLHVYLPEVDGLTVGAPVRVDGVEVGNVQRIVLASEPSATAADRARNIRVDMRLQKRFQDYIRSDSAAGLITEGLLGNRYVDIDRGYLGTPMVDGQEIPGRHEAALKAMLARGTDLMETINSIAQKTDAVLDNVKNGRGSMGKFLADPQAYDHLNQSLNNLDSVIAGVRQGRGTLGKLVVDDAMYNNVNSAAGHLDSVLDAVQTKQGTLGKLVYDSSFHDSAKQFIDNGNAVLGDVRAGKGTLGKLATDDSLFLQYRKAGESLSSAMEKLNDNQGSAGKLFTDPKLYDNLSGLTGDLRLLIGDFRKDPKKFLNAKFSLF